MKQTNSGKQKKNMKKTRNNVDNDLGEVVSIFASYLLLFALHHHSQAI